MFIDPFETGFVSDKIDTDVKPKISKEKFILGQCARLINSLPLSERSSVAQNLLSEYIDQAFPAGIH